MIILKPLSLLSIRHKKKYVGLIFFICTVGLLLASFSFSKKAKLTSNSFVENKFQELIKSIDSLTILVQNDAQIINLQQQYTLCRKNYKQIEAVVEYVSPFYSKYYINGPPLKKHALENGNKIIEPHGFQLIEPIFFSNDTSLSKAELVYEIKLLKETIFQTEKKYKSVVPLLGQYFDMVQFELVRLVSLNINGYDCAITKENIKEINYVLDGIFYLLESNLEVKTKSKLLITLKNEIEKTKIYVSAHSNYDTFDRLNFIVDYIKPLYALIFDIKSELKLAKTPVNYAINFNERTLFGNNFYNKLFFSVNIADSENTVLQAQLGKSLFFDPILSKNNKRACASCHKPNLAFGDTVQKNLEFNRGDFLRRNTPPLLNVMYQKSFFMDGRALQLEDQISEVLHTQNEMNSLPEEMIFKLQQSDEYITLFKKAFKGKSDTSITFYAILKSIAEYEKTLQSLNSRFDNYIRGDKKSLTKNEINGYTLFSGKALCGSCHFLPLFNGLVPPIFSENEFEVIGITSTPLSTKIDLDSGRVAITKKSIHTYSFKTPSIRNLQFSYPYMHNGSFKSIDEVLDFYNKGGGNTIINNIPQPTLPFDSLKLNGNEKRDLKSFLMTLSDNHYKNSAPKALPKFKNEILNKRKIGGEY